jgi:hypothetical protein
LLDTLDDGLVGRVGEVGRIGDVVQTHGERDQDLCLARE